MNTNEGLKDQLLLAQRYANGELEAECDDEAFQQCRLVGERGGAKVLYFLGGGCYHYGRGTARDLKAAIKCYARAAELSSFEALKRLYGLRSGQSVKTDLQNVFRGFCEKADQGDARAQFNAGYCQYYRIGTLEDKKKAKDLFLKAADQGCADAMWMLEVCRDHGFGDGYNGRKEIELLKYAAELGSAEAQNKFGEFGKQRYLFSIIDNLENKKDKEVETACKNYQQTAEWFQKAVDQNRTEATSNLAYCYCYGQGVKRDIKKAFQLYKKAALMGVGEAQNRISQFYIHGYFNLSEDEWPVGIDFFEAAYWNRTAVDQCHDFAKNNMPYILNAIELSQDQINELMSQTSSFESAKIWYNIAMQCETGDGVEKDEKKAFKMYKLSARLGSRGGQIALARCNEQGIGTGVDLSQAVHWYEKAAIQGGHEAAAHLLDLMQSESAAMAPKEGSAFAALAECYQTGNGVVENEDRALLMREFAAVNGDIEQAKVVIEAYISGNGSEYRIKFVGSIVAMLSGLSREDYQQFIEQFNGSIGELDQMQILQHMAAATRGEIMGINIIFE